MIPYASTATIVLSYRAEAVGGAVEGFGFIVPRIEGRDLIAATWTSLKWPHRAPAGHVLIRCYVGGVGREAVLQLSDDQLVARVRAELAAICGLNAEPTYVEVNRWWKAMPQYTIGHLDRLAQLDAALSRYGGLVLTGAGYRGVGIPDCIRDGALAAGTLVEFLSRHPA
jgi:oxygen-dependent protoporphyrinogen oxidase